MKMKKLISCLLAGMMAVSLSVSADVQEQEPQEADTQEAESSDEVIEVLYWQSTQRDWKQEYVDKFNSEHTDIHVTLETFPDHGPTMQKLQAQVAAGNAELPNLLQIDTCMTPVVDNVAPLVDLSSYLEESETLKLENFYDAFQEESYVGDKICGLHVMANGDVLYYNKAIFEEAGLDPEDPPENWEEVISYGLQIKENCGSDIIPFAYSGINGGGYYEFMSWEWQAMVASAGGTLFNEDYTEPTFNSPEGLEALKYLVEAVTVQGIATLNYPENGFENGAVGMYMQGSWQDVAYTEALGDDLGVGALPGKNESVAVVGGDQIMIIDSGDEKVNAAAFKVMEYMMSAEVLVRYAQESGELVCQIPIAESDEYQEVLQASATMPVAQVGLESCAYRARTPWYTEWSQMIFSTFEPCVYGEVSCEDALADLETQTIELIEKYK